MKAKKGGESRSSVPTPAPAELIAVVLKSDGKYAWVRHPCRGEFAAFILSLSRCPEAGARVGKLLTFPPNSADQHVQIPSPHGRNAYETPVVIVPFAFVETHTDEARGHRFRREGVAVGPSLNAMDFT
jgi:hypothetical protein